MSVNTHSSRGVAALATASNTGLMIDVAKLRYSRRATADFKVQEVHEKPIRSLSFLDTLLGNI